MRSSMLWNTIKQVQLERRLVTVPRRERILLRGFVDGKNTR